MSTKQSANHPEKSPGRVWRLMSWMNHRMARNYRRGIGPAKVVLLLTTIGRKSGVPRVTPLQYEEIDGQYYLGSARGTQADWYRNILINPQVEFQIREHKFTGAAEAVTDVGRIADFLALRLKRHPLMMGLLMRLEGLPLRFSRADFEQFAAQKALVVIHPESADLRI